MKTIISRLALLLTGASLILLNPVFSSSAELDERNTQHNLSHLPSELFPLITEQLSIAETVRAGEVCKSWLTACNLHLKNMLSWEGSEILHDTQTISHMLSSDKVSSFMSALYQERHFVFVPFNQSSRPSESCALTKDDLKPDLLTLFNRAFHKEEKTELSAQDLLCLEAVLPWSRMVYNPTHANGKQRAIETVKKVSPNEHLIRFAPDLNPAYFNETPHTFVLTTEEFVKDTYTNHLGTLLITHADHRVHLVVEEGYCYTNNRFSLPDYYLRHLTLSDPQGIVLTIANSFLQNCGKHSSLHFKHFPALKDIGDSFLQGATFDTLTLCLPRLDTVGYKFLSNLATGPLILRLPSLKTAGNSFASFIKADTIVLDCPVLTELKGGLFLRNTNARSVTINMPCLLSLEGGDLCHSKNLTHLNIVDLSALTHIGTQSLLFNPNLCDVSRHQLSALYHEVESKPEGIVQFFPDIRVLSDFSADQYLLYNPDVNAYALNKGLDPKRFALTHYKSSGYKEVRRYRLPTDFDVMVYLALNDDVRAYASTQPNSQDFAVQHFITRQQIENRPYKFNLPKGFTPESYLTHNPDLAAHLQSNTLEERNNKLKAHYTNSGRHEERKF